MSESRRRVSYTQLLQLWEFLNENREIAVGFNKSAQARNHSKNKWERAAVILNSTGDGATKTGSEWSKYWVDLKAKIKRKNRLLRDSRQTTGGGRPIQDDLSDLEKNFLTLLGTDYGCCLPGIQVDPLVHVEMRQTPQIIEDRNVNTINENEDPIYLEIASSEETPEVLPPVEPVTTEDTESLPSATTPVTRDVQPPTIVDNCNSAGDGQSMTRGVSSSGVGGPTRRRRTRQHRQISIAEARERLVRSSENRAQAEAANSRSLEKGVQILGEIASLLKGIHDRLNGASPTSAQQDPAV